MTNLITPKDLLVFCTGAHYKKDIKGWNTIKVVNADKNNTKLDASVYKKDNRIVIAIKDITEQDRLEFKALNRQLMNNNWKLPTQEELDERVARGELIWVDGYTKQDGTVVKGYFRHYPETA